MKKKKVIMKGVPEELHRLVIENPLRIIQVIHDTETPMPDEATHLLLCIKLTTPKFDLRFYETQEDFLLDYTGCLLKNRDDYEFHVFRAAENIGWEMYMPPPIIGLGVKTKLRSGLSF